MAACGSSNSSSNSSSGKSSSAIKVRKESKTDEPSFKNNKLTLTDLDIQITQEKVIPVGQKGNEYGKKPVIAFWYKVTNKTGKEIDPSIFISLFEAVQDNDKNKVNKLNVAALPDERFLDSQSQTIKKGGTVENAVAYDLTDETTPIKLTATVPATGKEAGSQTYDIK
nr:DUF5067 domain-containing protein [Lacticaseibacillus saniviri]